MFPLIDQPSLGQPLREPENSSTNYGALVNSSIAWVLSQEWTPNRLIHSKL